MKVTENLALGVSQPWHAMPAEETLAALGTPATGLSSAEAARRLTAVGPNRLREAGRPSPWQIFIGQFKNVLILLLLGAILLSAAVGEFLDAIVIFAIVFASAVLGFVQEYRSERAIEALKKMTSPMATTIRDGAVQEILSEELVPGDLLLISAGGRIPADCRLLEAFSLRVEEAALTGESVPVEKDARRVVPPEAPVGDRCTMVFMGTVATYGRARAVVTATGMRTEIGRIAEMLQAMEEETTPLAERMDYIGKRLGAACLLISALVVVLGVARGNPLLGMFIWGVSLAIAAVPEALAAVVTGALAIGVQRAARRNAIVRRLPAVETLGCTTVICSDKTGTLTRNEMMVRQVYTAGALWEVSGVGYEPVGSFSRDGLVIDPGNTDLVGCVEAAALCNDATVHPTNGGWQISGDPTEVALVVVAAKAKVDVDSVRGKWPRVAEIPFESERKRMTTIHQGPGEELIACIKGAPELVLQCCSAHRRDGRTLPLSPEDRQAILDVNERMAQGALRVLAVATRELTNLRGEFSAETVETGLTFLGLCGMIDPPREEVKEAVRRCRASGIRVVMVTGDHRLTAAAVARELGILANGEGCPARLLEGTELGRISAADLSAVVEDVAVYARVSPEHKMKIIEAWKQRGHVVAMTGDGVNDAPALKMADIGVAMGITGTDVTKETADMILMDDNFATIAAAVEEGRIIYDNIKKYLVFLLSCNIAEILLLGLAGILGFPLPLIPAQLLWINLMTDGLPALALGIEPGEPDVMRRPPRDPKEPLFTRRTLLFISVLALALFAGVGPVSYGYWRVAGLEQAQTMTFLTFIAFELLYAFNCRSERLTVVQLGLGTNPWLIWAILSSVASTAALFTIGPLAGAFHLVPLAARDWMLAAGIAAAAFLLVEGGKRAAAKKRTRPRISTGP